MTKMHDQRAEAIARITAVRDEVLAREAAKPQLKPKVAKLKVVQELPMDEASVKKREQRRKKTAKRDERRRQRCAADPVYAEKFRQQRKQWYLKRKERLGADTLNQKAKESIARVRVIDPESWLQRQKKYQRQSRERQKARMASDPVYAEQVRAKRRAKKKERNQRQAAELRELRALRAQLKANPPESPDSCRQL